LVCHDNLVRPADLHLAPLQSKTGVVRTIVTNPLEGFLFELFTQNAPNLYESLTETIIRTAYRYCRNNHVQTARLLGISRNILRAHLKQLGLIGSSTEAKNGKVEEEV
jgi:sigma-54-specific transcriptional regulator